MKDLVIECRNVFNVIHNKIYSIYTLKRRWKHAHNVLSIAENMNVGGRLSFLVGTVLPSWSA